MANLKSTSAIAASSSSLLVVRVVLLLVRVELLPDPEPALLLLLLTDTSSPIDWELWRHPCWPTNNFDAPYGGFFQRVIREYEGGERGEGGEEEGGVEGAGTFQAVLTKVINVSKLV